MAKEFNDANFKSEVLDSDKLSVIDFWAEWCGPCRAIGPVVEELSLEWAGKVNIGKVNVDHNPQLTFTQTTATWQRSKSRAFSHQFLYTLDLQ